ncbi:hypothetical protein psal_cds_1066 [Pandoravirus salinus]|uniref:Ankyrin repeat domain containing protein n=1 Tax=Pandoravirus salinus TaxID=1349410 RepID=S4VX68_9VIRU|nr:hypothetical protein psal_cds_1066 [Pandoravirus salinus]AGO85274.1 hypothetical protein psal_cds_1066 [Pandoravirus salinus]
MDARQGKITIGDLPVELRAHIVDLLNDHDFCACRLAHRSLCVVDADAIEKRAAMWRGCRTPEDFSARGNIYALGLMHARGVAVHGWHCAGEAAANGHIHVLDFLRHRGLVRDDDNSVWGWRSYACTQAATRGRLDVVKHMYETWTQKDNTVLRSAIRGDALPVLVWLCDRLGSPPTADHIKHAVEHEAVAIVAHYRHALPDGAVDWGLVALEAISSTRHRTVDLLRVLLQGGISPWRQHAIARRACTRRQGTDVIEVVYEMLPDAFSAECVRAAASAGTLDQICWLCAKQPHWADEAALVSLNDAFDDDDQRNADERAIVTLWELGLLRDLARILYTASARGNTTVLGRLLSCPKTAWRRYSLDNDSTSPVGPPTGFDRYEHDEHIDPVCQDWVAWRNGLPADHVAALLQGALARFCIDGERDMLDWLDQRGFSAWTRTDLG